MKKNLYLLAASMLFAASPAFAQDTITIGFTASQTGALNNNSTAQMRGIELWRDDVNAKGGIKVGGKSYTVKLVTYDDESQNTRVQQLYTRLITQDKAQFLISPYSSGLVATAAIISEQYGKVMITTGGALEKTYKLGNKNLFQLYTGSSQYLAGALLALKEKNPKPHVAFVYEDDPFSKAVVGAVRDTAKKQGDVIAADESYAGSTTDFSPVINKMIAAKADALLGGGHYADGATLARQLHEQKAGVKWITLLVAPDSPKFAELGDAAVGISVPSQWEPQAAFKPDFGPTVAAIRQGVHRQVQDRACLSCGRRLRGRLDPAARNGEGRFDRSGQGGGPAQRPGCHHVFRPHQIFERPEGAWPAGRSRYGARPVAEEERQAGQRSDLAESGQDR